MRDTPLAPSDAGDEGTAAVVATKIQMAGFLGIRSSSKETLEPLSDDAGDARRSSLFRKTMRRSIYLDKLGAGRYQLDCSLQFLNGAEDVLGAADE